MSEVLQFRLKEYKVDELHLCQVPESELPGVVVGEQSVQMPSESLAYSADFYDDELHRFDIVFNVEVQSSFGVLLTVKKRFIFETKQELSQEWRASKFATVNAPAIAYPYLRSFVSTILLNSGHDVAILPTVNFVEMAKKASQ